MKIPIGKDLEKDYKNVIILGLDGPELFWAGLGIAIIVGVAFVAGYYFKVPTQLCVMVGIPFSIPAFLMGFTKIQGLSVFGYFKEYLYDKMTEELIYEAGELPPSEGYWTMERENKRRRKNK